MLIGVYRIKVSVNQILLTFKISFVLLGSPRNEKFSHNLLTLISFQDHKKPFKYD